MALKAFVVSCFMLGIAARDVNMVRFGVFKDANCTQRLLPGLWPTLNVSSPCFVKTYTDPAGKPQTNAQTNFNCEADALTFTQYPGSDKCLGDHTLTIHSRLTKLCSPVQTHMGVTYQKLMDYDSPCTVHNTTTAPSPFRTIFDASQALMTGKEGAKFPESQFSALVKCMDISPNLVKAQNHAWDGFLEYFAANQNESAADAWGKDPVVWHESYSNRKDPLYTGGPTLQTMAYNESFPSIPIYEPCNFVSNFAYYRVAPEVCHKAAHQSMSEESRRGVVESLAILGFGSAFFHASDTHLGESFDVHMIDVLAYNAHQIAVEHLPTLGKPEILRDLAWPTPRNMSATEISGKLTNDLLTTPPSQWAALMPRGAAGPPGFTLAFAGMISTILEAVFPRVIVNALVPSIMGLFGMDKGQQDFVINKFLPTVSESLSQIPLRLVDKVALLKKLLAFVMKIVFAFAYQESYFTIKFFLRKDVNLLGGLLLPALNALGDVLSGDIWWEKGISLGLKVYPGDEKCRLRQPHAKWHEMSADAFLELVYVADKMNEMTSPKYTSQVKADVHGADDATVFTLDEFEGWARQARLVSAADAPVEAFVEEVRGAFKAFDANADGEATYKELISKLEDLAAEDKLRFSGPEVFVERLLQASAAQAETMV